MRKLIVAIAALFALAGGSVAAQAPYFGAPTVSATPGTVAPGGDVTVTVQNCDVGSTVEIELAGSAVGAACTDETPSVQGFRAPAQTPQPGTATGVVAAPTAAGTYDGTAAGTSNGEGFSLSFQVSVEVPATVPDSVAEVEAALPSTGGGGAEPLMVSAVVLLVVGLGLLVVSRIRRRRDTAAA